MRVFILCLALLLTACDSIVEPAQHKYQVGQLCEVANATVSITGRKDYWKGYIILFNTGKAVVVSEDVLRNCRW